MTQEIKRCHDCGDPAELSKCVHGHELCALCLETCSKSPEAKASLEKQRHITPAERAIDDAWERRTP